MGADWPLVQDALIIAALAVGAGAGGLALFLRFRGRRMERPVTGEETAQAEDSLEGRVRVLERIATDRSADLDAEIEALRDTKMEVN